MVKGQGPYTPGMHVRGAPHAIASQEAPPGFSGNVLPECIPDTIMQFCFACNTCSYGNSSCGFYRPQNYEAAQQTIVVLLKSSVKSVTKCDLILCFTHHESVNRRAHRKELLTWLRDVVCSVCGVCSLSAVFQSDLLSANAENNLEMHL